MQNSEKTKIVIDGIAHDVTFADEFDDAERAEAGLPPRGSACSCRRCVCANEADTGTLAVPLCGCCRADCPDVHPNGRNYAPWVPTGTKPAQRASEA